MSTSDSTGVNSARLIEVMDDRLLRRFTVVWSAPTLGRVELPIQKADEKPDRVGVKHRSQSLFIAHCDPTVRLGLSAGDTRATSRARLAHRRKPLPDTDWFARALQAAAAAERPKNEEGAIMERLNYRAGLGLLPPRGRMTTPAVTSARRTALGLIPN